MKRYIVKTCSLSLPAENCRSAFRFGRLPGLRNRFGGFRLVIRHSYGPHTVSGIRRVTFRDIGFHWFGSKKRGFRFVI